MRFVLSLVHAYNIRVYYYYNQNIKIKKPVINIHALMKNTKILNLTKLNFAKKHTFLVKLRHMTYKIIINIIISFFIPQLQLATNLYRSKKIGNPDGLKIITHLGTTPRVRLLTIIIHNCLLLVGTAAITYHGACTVLYYNSIVVYTIQFLFSA